MRKSIKFLPLCIVLALSLNSCFTYTTTVGKGAQGNSKVAKSNTYFINGLIQTKQSDAKEMANGATNYTVVTKHTFINMLLGAITFGIYTPTTTTVTK